MKKWKILIISIALLAVNTNFANIQIIDKIVAVVNHDIILQSEVDFLIKLINLNIYQMRQQIFDNKTNFSNQVLEHLILDKIILQMNKKIGFQVSNKYLNQIIVDIANTHNTTPFYMKKQLEYVGIDYNDYLNQLRKEIIISEILNNEVGRHIVILPEEVQTIKKQLDEQNDDNTEINFSHILISFPENPTQNQISEAENQAKFIMNRALNGEDFNKLAIIYSSDHTSIKENQVWRHIQELPFDFVKILKKEKKNHVIGPIRSNSGFYILKINDLRQKNTKFFITEVHIRHILLKSSSNMKDNQIRQYLVKISDDIRNKKTSFANAAKRFSQDFKSSKKGGDLGWISIDTYGPIVRNILTKLEKNQISEPIRSSFGWHLIEMIDIRCVDNRDVITKEQAYQILFKQKFSKEIRIWLQKQRDCAYIKILLNS